MAYAYCSLASNLGNMDCAYRRSERTTTMASKIHHDIRSYLNDDDHTQRLIFADRSTGYSQAFAGHCQKSTYCREKMATIRNIRPSFTSHGTHCKFMVGIVERIWQSFCDSYTSRAFQFLHFFSSSNTIQFHINKIAQELSATYCLLSSTIKASTAPRTTPYTPRATLHKKSSQDVLLQQPNGFSL
jgi:hypothetical protein